jgi:hypothetical protein
MSLFQFSTMDMDDSWKKSESSTNSVDVTSQSPANDKSTSEEHTMEHSGDADSSIVKDDDSGTLLSNLLTWYGLRCMFMTFIRTNHISKSRNSSVFFVMMQQHVTNCTPMFAIRWLLYQIKFLRASFHFHVSCDFVKEHALFFYRVRRYNLSR